MPRRSPILIVSALLLAVLLVGWRVLAQSPEFSASLRARGLAALGGSNLWSDFYSLSSQRCLVSLPAGTVIDAYDPDGVHCGTSTVAVPGEWGVMHVYGDNPQTAAVDEGAEDGDVITFFIDGTEATVSSGPAQWSPRSLNRADLGTASVSQDLAGYWNLMSMVVEPVTPAIETVLEPVSGSYDLVLGEAGVYDPTLPAVYQTLHEMHAGAGYYVRVAGPAAIALQLCGPKMAPGTPLPLHAGWNWIGYLPEACLPITTALQSITGNYLIVHSLDQTYVAAQPEYSTLLEMCPGQGYLIRASSPVTLTYPAAGGTGLGLAQPVAGDIDRRIAPTPFFTVVFGRVTLNGSPAPPGTRIEVVTPRGEVAGIAVVGSAGRYGFSHVFGEDAGAATPILGFRDGEPLGFRVNGLLASASETMLWRDDKEPHTVNLDVDTSHIFLPMVHKHEQ